MVLDTPATPSEIARRVAGTWPDLGPVDVESVVEPIETLKASGLVLAG